MTLLGEKNKTKQEQIKGMVSEATLIPWGSRVPITKINFCAFVIFRVVRTRAQNAKINCPFVSNTGNILEPKRTNH